MEENKTLVVRDASLYQFVLGFSCKEQQDKYSRFLYDKIPFSFAKEIIYKKDIISEIEVVIIEIVDYAMKSGIELISTFTYKVEPYDDLSVKLVLDKSDSRRA